MQITVKNNQSIFDISLLTAGSLEAIFDIAQLNDLSLTDNFIAGTIINYDAFLDKKIADYFASNNIIPATAYNAEIEAINLPEFQYSNSGDNDRIAVFPEPKKQIIVQNNQSIFDIALISSGSIEEAVEMSVLVDISLTDQIASGTVFDFVPAIADKKTVNYFISNSITPATDFNTEIEVLALPGFVYSVTGNNDAIELFSEYRREAVVLNNQTIFDIALQHTGNVEEAFDAALFAQISLTDDLSTGHILSIAQISDEKTFSYYKNNNLHPATALAVEAIAYKIFDFTFDFTFE